MQPWRVELRILARTAFMHHNAKGHSTFRFKHYAALKWSKHYPLVYPVVGRELRLRTESERRGTDVDLAPDEFELALNDPEFRSSHQKEINHLKEQLDRALHQIESLKLGVSTCNIHIFSDTHPLFNTMFR